jgi:phenylpropionate dioxygenase-like ring-hydroxylating dioxygenase large terminal subunit
MATQLKPREVLHGPEIGDRIQENRVHGSLYTDEELYRSELERIWYKTWVYVGHESEVPNNNDYVMKSIGPQSVLMTRDKNGEIHLLQNRCPHRGNVVCQSERGNTKMFSCPFHQWTFSNTGDLIGFAFPEGYRNNPEAAKSGLGLGKVPRVASYRGFVFGSFAEEGETLEEHLGGAAEMLDRLCLNGPEGEVELTAGFLQHKVKSNWKFVVENETDGYHPAFVHSSIFGVADSGIGGLYGDKSTALARDYGNGHTEMDLRPEFRNFDEPMRWFGTTADRLPDYVVKMNAAYGEEKARSIMIDGTPHAMIYPNLFIAEIQIFSIQPISVNETIQHVTALQFKGAPDFNRRLRQQTMGSVGPAGFLLADDATMYEGTQLGVESKNPEWLFVGRGSQRERRDEDGYRVSHITDETPTRGIWRHYQAVMEAE